MILEKKEEIWKYFYSSPSMQNSVWRFR